MKLHAILEAQYHLGKGQVELTQAKHITPEQTEEFARAARTAWPHGVTYKGNSIFKMVYTDGVARQLEKYLEDNNRAEQDLENHDSQESYLGYVPSKDMFIQGFDVWAELEQNVWGGPDDEDDEISYGPELSNVVLYKLNEEGKVTWQQSRYFRDRMMYPNVHRALHYEFKDLIDVRLG